MEQQFLIKGMVCDRCVNFITQGAGALGLPILSVTLGKIVFGLTLTPEDQVKLVNFLCENGFEPMSNRYEKLVRQTRRLVADYLEMPVGKRKDIRFSAFLSDSLHYNYDSISELFSASEGITLEKYLIHQRLEKVKELLVYTDKSLSEISYESGFSSINHLSRQFRELEGLPPSHYRQVKRNKERAAVYRP